MSQNETAGYDPIFFFHHCNVDRLFERYIQQMKSAKFGVPVLKQFQNYVPFLAL